MRENFGGTVKHFLKRYLAGFFALAGFSICCASQVLSYEVIQLTRDTAVEIAMNNSYNIKQLELGIRRTRYWLKAERAALKSKVYMNINAPEIDAVADYKWNSTLRKNEIIHQNTRRWQMDVSVRQPVILLGYPTNGYLSLNNKIYRYLQKENGLEDVDYYNRFFFKFEQPIFLPNELKNDIENAELNVQREELNYIRNRVGLANQVAYDFYNLFGLVYRDGVYTEQVRNLQRVYEIARDIAGADTTRVIEEIQARVELANITELQMKNRSNFRMRILNMKQRLRLDIQDSLVIRHDIDIKKINIDFDKALEYCYTLRPHLRLLRIEKRRREISLNNAHGWDSFRLNFEITFGLEKNHDRYQAMMDEYDNSYSVSLNAYIPIWDWGRRKAWIGAERVNVQRAELNIDENMSSLRNSLNTTVTDLEDYQQRALNLRESVIMAREIVEASIGQYRDGDITLQNVLQIIKRQNETELNFLEAYLGYRRELQELKGLTFFDFETDSSMIDKYKPES